MNFLKITAFSDPDQFGERLRGTMYLNPAHISSIEGFKTHRGVNCTRILFNDGSEDGQVLYAREPVPELLDALKRL